MVQGSERTGKLRVAKRRPVTTTIPAKAACARLASILKQVSERKARFVITKNGRAAAVILGARDFDDMLEELDPEFQKSLIAAAKEHRAGKSIALKDYLKERQTRRAG
jgi:prevent-host-death family protein